MRSKRAHIFICIVMMATTVIAGVSPLRTLVVVNDDSDQSLEAGRYYAELRGIPDRNIFHLFTTNRINIELSTYSNEVEGPVRAYISDAGISNQIDTVVFSMDIPHRVRRDGAANMRWAGMTACMYYGFYSSPSSCQLTPGSNHDYFEAEQSFDRAGPLINHQYYLSAMITASNLASAKSLIRRSVAADYSQPSASVFLLRTDDSDRWIQWKEFGETLFMNRFTDAPEKMVWLDAASLTGRTNVFGVTAGRGSHNWLSSNVNIPGAYADHLTSYGGYLFETRPEPTQMSILDWVFHGFSGSYGTVVEPCAYTNKFTSPRLHYWYARGFSLGESHWMSVQNPYQGIFVGDPLCAPFAHPPGVNWAGLTNGTVIAGTITATAIVEAASLELPVQSIEWWVDDWNRGDVTNIIPAAGNVISVSVNNSNRYYSVSGSDTISSIASGIAAEINMAPSLGVTARSYGDRVVIKQDTLGVGATGWTCVAFATAGTASTVTVHVDVPETNFLETAITAREGLTLSGNSKSGDVVRAIITRLDGEVFTNTYNVVADGASTTVIMAGLRNEVNGNTNLLDSGGCLLKNISDNGSGDVESWLFARTNTWEGHNLFVDYEIEAVVGSTLTGPDFSDNFNDNKSVLGARATLFISAGVTQLSAAVSLNTTNWPDGPHEITLAARDGSGVDTEGRSSVHVVVDNHDLDCSINTPMHGIYRLKAGVLTVEVTTVVSAGSVTQLMLYAEGKPVSTGTTGTASVDVALDKYGSGTLNLQAHAWATSAREAISGITSVRLYTDEDGDSLSDQWECDNFGSTTNHTGESDADEDGCSNYKEFISDTEPTNGMSFLSISALNSDLTVSFNTSSRRRYQIRQNDELINGIWYPVGDSFAGTGSAYLWTNALPATNTIRFHAVEPTLPQ